MTIGDVSMDVILRSMEMSRMVKYERFTAKQQVAEKCFCQRSRDEGVRQMRREKKKKNLQHLVFFLLFLAAPKLIELPKSSYVLYIER